MTGILQLNTVEAIERHRDSWQELWEETSGRSFAQSVDWYLAWCREMAPDVQPRVMLVSAAGRTVGLLPLVERRDSTSRSGLRTLAYAAAGWSAFCSPLGRNPAATLFAAMRWLRDQPRRYDEIVLENLDAEDRDRGRTRNALRACDMQAIQEPCGKVPLIDLSADQAAFDSSRPAEMLDDLTSAEQRLARQGRVQFVRFRADGHTAAESGTTLLEHCHRLRRLSAGALAGPMSSTPLSCGRRLSDRFLSDTHAAAVGAAAADISLLHLAGEPVAAVYSHQVEGRLEGVYCGMHPEAPAEAMLVLFDRMVRDSFQRGDRSMVPPAGLIAPWQGWVTGMLPRSRVTHTAATSWQAGLERLKQLFRPSSKRDPDPIGLPDVNEPAPREQVRPHIAAATGVPVPAVRSSSPRPQLRIARFTD